MTHGLPAWAGSVDAEVLARLLGLGGERDWLDYKRQCDLSSKRDLMEITKDIGAMMITGGYIVIGADDHGCPAGEVEHLELFDPATVHAKVARYVPPPFELRVSTHPCQGQSFALVYITPHPDGFCVFERDGTYPHIPRPGNGPSPHGLSGGECLCPPRHGQRAVEPARYRHDQATAHRRC